MINDTIDVVLETGTHKYGDHDEPYELIHLVLNGETIKGTFDAFEFSVPRTKKFISFLMTCSCGVPECAGYHYGVKVKRRAYTVEWRDAEKVDEGYSKYQTFPKKFYSFNRTQYEAIQDKCLAYLHHIAHEREINGRPYKVDDPDMYDFDRSHIIPWMSVKELENSIKLYKERLPYIIQRQELDEGWWY